MRVLLAAFAAVFCWAVPSVVQAQERFAIQPGFAYPSDHQVTIAVFRPDTKVSSLTAGGVNEPNADWTETARKLIAEALQRNQKVAGATLNFVKEPDGDDAAYLAEYRALFRAVALAIQQHKLFVGNRLGTKKEAFDWTLGNGTQRIGEFTHTDYGLFFYTLDAYGSAGRKAAQIFGAMFGVAIIPGVHIGYAGLVDFKTGNVVWFNADPQMGGDVRTPEGADKRVGQLLNGLPGLIQQSAPAASPTATAAK